MEGSESYQPTYQEMRWKSGMLLVEETGQNMARVVRLISTNPTDFLDPTVAPGSIIEYKPESRAAMC
jgi:hypothetical protein